jgi:tetratricopeptide (TPR) repeat protein
MKPTKTWVVTGLSLFLAAQEWVFPSTHARPDSGTDAAMEIPSATAASSSAPGAAATPEPPREDAYARALSLYRQDRFAEAGRILETAIREGGELRGYRTLLGWCYLRQENPTQAADSFRKALAGEPGSTEARQGLAASLVRTGRIEEALDLILPVVADQPGNADALGIATQALAAAKGSHDRRLSRSAASGKPRAVARAGADYLEVPSGGRFTPLFVKGVNLGVALPGRFPAEFPEDVATYRGWLDQIATMGANVVRLYTLLPPAFYQALLDHNRSIQDGRGRLWLVQGVWTELPEEDRYDDPAFEGAFREEMERIVDVLHGNIAVARRPGHAFGLYRHDVSDMTLAWILGREWEPFSVEAYDASHPARRFSGRYFTLAEGTAMEAWLASQMDHVTAYEAGRYGVMRPVAFTNWPTLDPLRHPTEATKSEEREIAGRLGLPFEARAVREYDNDGVGIDANRIRPTLDAAAGQFASYHAYPYYPDFMNVDPLYLRARDRLGPNNYAGYLADLRRHHTGMPVLISEIGVPTSRGVAHVQPQGFHHGGHNEISQGEIDARLMENIHEARCAGGILFAWLDEWFKKNWLVMEFEVPPERNPKWLNALDAEQNYGLLAARPGTTGPRILLDGKGDDWSGSTILAKSESAAADGTGIRLTALRAAHDEGYFYLRLDVAGWDAGPDGAPDWDRARFLVGIDTYGEKEGDHRFPKRILEAPTGMEFMLDLTGEKTSRILVDTPYDLGSHRYNRPYRSVPNDDGVFIEIKVETNRRRVGRDGTVYPETVHDLSPLVSGTTDPNAPGYDDLADWSANARAGMIEVRLPWGLLNVTDPSSRRVVDDPPAFRDEVGTRVTEGFRLYAAAVDPGDGRVLSTLPERDEAGRLAAAPGDLYVWKGWEEPTYHTRLKRSYFILKERLAPLHAVAP